MWRQIRRDFPPRANRLLELVDAAWFEPTGYLVAASGTLEKAFLEKTLDELGPWANDVRRQMTGLAPGQRSALDSVVRAGRRRVGSRA